MNLSLSLTERFRFSQVMRCDTRDPRSEVSYPALWLDIFVVQHLSIVVDNRYSKNILLKSVCTYLASPSLDLSISTISQSTATTGVSLIISNQYFHLPLECVIARSEYGLYHGGPQSVALRLIHPLSLLLIAYILFMLHFVAEFHISLLVRTALLLLLLPFGYDLV